MGSPVRERSIGAFTVPKADPRIDRRDVLLCGALAGTALISGLASLSLDRPEPQAAQLDALVPDRIGRWTRSDQGGVLIPTGESLTTKTYDEILTRLYTSPSASPIMLLIAYGGVQSGATQLHRPEACYPAAGFALGKRSDLTLRLAERAVPARLITARGNGRTEQILYWSRVGGDFPASASAQRWSVIRHNLRGSIPDGVLVRISAVDENAASLGLLLREFAAALIEGGGPGTRSLLLGSA
jgi:EpsI family protein